METRRKCYRGDTSVGLETNVAETAVLVWIFVLVCLDAWISGLRWLWRIEEAWCFVSFLICIFIKIAFLFCSAHDIRRLNNEMKSGLCPYSMGTVDAATALSTFRVCLGVLSSGVHAHWALKIFRLECNHLGSLRPSINWLLDRLHCCRYLWSHDSGPIQREQCYLVDCSCATPVKDHIRIYYPRKEYMVLPIFAQCLEFSAQK